MTAAVTLELAGSAVLASRAPDSVSVEAQHESGVAVEATDRRVTRKVIDAGAEFSQGRCSKVAPVEAIECVSDEVVRPTRAGFRPAVTEQLGHAGQARWV